MTFYTEDFGFKRFSTPCFVMPYFWNFLVIRTPRGFLSGLGEVVDRECGHLFLHSSMIITPDM